MTENLKKRIITSVFLVSLLIFMYFYVYILIISLIIISIITWIEFCSLIAKIFLKDNLQNKFLKMIFKAISLFYLSMITYLIILYQNTDAGIIILFSMLVAIASDIGGLIVGKTFEGKKLTKISPKKTISGTIGSLIFSLLLIPFFTNDLLVNNISLLILITLGISLVSQLGDLFISLLKRKANVKDTSDILPGHGGFLDRIDGIIFAIPAGILLLSLT